MTGLSRASLALIGIILLAASGCEDLLSHKTAEPELDFPATTTAKKIVDTDYRFQLSPPGGAWRLMGEKEIQKMAPDALAGAVNPAGKFGVVIVEPAPQADPRSMAQLIVTNMPLENKQIGPYQKVEFSGLPAIRVSVRGTTEGLSFGYVNHILIHQGYCYQIMGGGLAQGDRDQDFEPFFKSFSILPGQVRGRAAARKLVDSQGMGWRVRSGVFESAAFGLRVAPTGPWRLAVGSELQQMNSNAEVGLTSEHAYLILLAEKAALKNREAYAQSLLADTARNISGKPNGKPQTVTIDGRKVTLHRLATSEKPTFEYLHGVLFEGDLAIQVMYWHLTGLKEQAQAQLPQALAAITFLSPSQHQRLGAELESGPDSQNSIGPDYSLRRGVWRDFAHGLVWTKPEGLWRVSPGEHARAFNQDASLVIENPSLGIFGMIIVEPIGKLTLRSHHDLVVANAFGGGDKLKSRARPGLLSSSRSLTSSGTKVESGMELSYLLTTCLYDKWALQFTFWGMPQSMEQGSRASREALAGLRMPGRSQPQSEKDHKRYLNRRMGFELALPQGKWSMTDLTPASLSGVGNVLDFRVGGQQVLAISVCALGEGQDREWFMRFIEETMRRKMVGLRMTRPERSTAKLAGQSWEVLRYSGPPRAEVHLTMRDRTFYALMVVHHNKGLPSGQLLSGFSFVD